MKLGTELKGGDREKVEGIIEKFIKAKLGLGEERWKGNGQVLTENQLDSELDIIRKLKEIMLEDELDILRHSYQDHPDIVARKIRQYNLDK